MDNLREDQARYVQEAVRLVKNGIRRFVLEMPTGGGKTRIAFAIARMAASAGRRVLFTSPRLSLLAQSAQRAESDEGGLRVGVYHGGAEPSSADEIVVTTNQTLVARYKRKATLPECSTLIIDECHTGVASSDAMRKIVAHYAANGATVIGLSATPWSVGMAKEYPELFPGYDPRLFQTKVRLTGPQQLIADGTIVPARAYAPMKVDVSGVKTQRDADGDVDYRESQLAEVMDAKVVARAMEWWMQLASGKRTIAFCVDVDHARCVAEEFIKHGVAAEIIHGYMDANTQRAVLDRYRSHVTQVLVNPLLLREGLDVTDIECVLWLRPTKNPKLWVQACGRAARAHPGKTEYLLLDCCGTIDLLGFPDEDRDIPLDDGKPRRSKAQEPGEQRVLTCKNCHAVIRKRYYPCDSCGYAPPLVSRVQEFEAYLAEVSRSASGSMARKLYGPESRHEMCNLIGARTMLGYLTFIADQRGYKRGWAYYKARDVFGARDPLERNVSPIEPPPEIYRYLLTCIKREHMRRGIANAYAQRSQ